MREYIQSRFPSLSLRKSLYDIASIGLGSCLLACLAHLSIPLGFTPVPITMGTLGVMLLGFLLGSKRGALAVLLYLCEGAYGLPVFASGVGVTTLFGPVGGYLFAFVLAAWVVGYMRERRQEWSILYTLSACTVASALILGCGVVWLSFLVGGIQKALYLGCYPFLLGDVCKVGLSVCTLYTMGRWSSGGGTSS